MKNQRLYIEGLEAFLENSGEDEADVNGILDQMPKFAPNFLNSERKVINILDIGSGNGRKGVILGKYFLERGLKVVIDCVEPKKEQFNRLIRTYQQDGANLHGIFYNSRFEDIRFDKRYDLVLLIHSIYEFSRTNEGLIPNIKKAYDLLNNESFGVVVIEHPDGDFRRLKRALYKRFGKKDPVNERDVARTLFYHRIPYGFGGKINFPFNLNGLLTSPNIEIGRKLGFLFSDSLNSETLSEEQYEQVGEWVRKSAKGESSKYLDTSDLSIWFFNMKR